MWWRVGLVFVGILVHWFTRWLQHRAFYIHEIPFGRPGRLVVNIRSRPLAIIEPIAWVTGIGLILYQGLKVMFGGGTTTQCWAVIGIVAVGALIEYTLSKAVKQ